jgi:hypothetical protein
MKSHLISAILILLVSSCQSDNSISPSDALLYYRWQLVQVQQSNNAPQLVSTTVFIAFGADGTIQYDESGKDGACCVPKRFARQVQTLLMDYSTGQPAYCQYVDIRCTSAYSLGPEWVVEQVDDQQLQLKIGEKRLIHKRAD